MMRLMIKDSMRVVCTLGEMMNEFSLSDQDVRNELGLDIRTIGKIRDNKHDWRLDRDALFKLILYGDEHGYEIFRVQPHDLWHTFEKSTALVFRSNKGTDAGVENHLSTWLRKINCDSETIIGCSDRRKVERSLRMTNCIVIGSPIVSLASEIVLALLWGARPFDSSNENCSKLPIRFTGRRPELSKPSAMVVAEGPPAIMVQSRGQKTWRQSKVNWQPREQYASARGSGRDAALLVVRRQRTISLDVTTVVIAGYTGLATLLASKAITHGEVPIQDSDLKDSRPHAAVYTYEFTKRVARPGGKLDNLRQKKEGSDGWAPPWENLK